MERLAPQSIRPRKPISASERPFLDAVTRIVAEHEAYWPISLQGQIEAWKFAITRAQVREFDLPRFLKAKPNDPTRRVFIERHGDDSVYELDALTPRQLADLFEEAINAVIDVDVYESELAQEERDLKAIAQLKKRILK
jgi:hypothetical protein